MLNTSTHAPLSGQLSYAVATLLRGANSVHKAKTRKIYTYRHVDSLRLIIRFFLIVLIPHRSSPGTPPPPRARKPNPTHLRHHPGALASHTHSPLSSAIPAPTACNRAPHYLSHGPIRHILRVRRRLDAVFAVAGTLSCGYPSRSRPARHFGRRGALLRRRPDGLRPPQQRFPRVLRHCVSPAGSRADAAPVTRTVFSLFAASDLKAG